MKLTDLIAQLSDLDAQDDVDDPHVVIDASNVDFEEDDLEALVIESVDYLASDDVVLVKVGPDAY
jgi:hypothetical protein